MSINIGNIQNLNAAKIRGSLSRNQTFHTLKGKPLPTVILKENAKIPHRIMLGNT